MDVSILGPLEIRSLDGREIRLPAGRERSLLVLLLIHRGEVVSGDRIIEALWGASPPDTATKAMQGYVSHLRRALDPGAASDGAPSAVVTQTPGYALRAGAVSVDAERFERLAAEGRRALEDGVPAEAAQRLDEALALWRGPALAEFAYDDFARDEIHRLEQLRMSAEEDRVDALLRLGRHGELVGRLEPLVAATRYARGFAVNGCWRSIAAAGRPMRWRPTATAAGCCRASSDSSRRPSSSASSARFSPRIPRSTPRRRPRRVRRPGRGEQALPPTRPRDAPRSRRRIVAVAALAVVAIAALAGVLVLTHGDTPAPVKVVGPAVAVIDAKTNRVVDSIAVGPEPLSIASGAGGIWVGDVKDGIVRRIDPATRRVTPIAITAPAIGLATGLGSVWVATGSNGTIVRIDPGLARVTDVIDLGSPDDPVVPTVSSVALSDGQLWVGAFGGLARGRPRVGSDSQEGRPRRPARRCSSRPGARAIWATLQTQRARRVEVADRARLSRVLRGHAPGLDRPRPVGRVAGRRRPRRALEARSRHGAADRRVPRRARHVRRRARRRLGLGRLVEGSLALSRRSGDRETCRRRSRSAGQPNSVVVRDGLVWVTVQARASPKPAAPPEPGSLPRGCAHGLVRAGPAAKPVLSG